MTHLLLAAESGSTIHAFVLPLVAACFFLLLGLVTWSYRDVANRHSQKFEATRPHESGANELDHLDH